MKEKQWIKVYKVCSKCNGTGRLLVDQENGPMCDCVCEKGKISEFVEVNKYIQKN